VRQFRRRNRHLMSKAKKHLAREDDDAALRALRAGRSGGKMMQSAKNLIVMAHSKPGSRIGIVDVDPKQRKLWGQLVIKLSGLLKFFDAPTYSRKTQTINWPNGSRAFFIHSNDIPNGSKTETWVDEVTKMTATTEGEAA
jgi:phage terminase large subunit-like protein